MMLSSIQDQPAPAPEPHVFSVLGAMVEVGQWKEANRIYSFLRTAEALPMESAAVREGHFKVGRHRVRHE
jgi:hypothetical protein